MKSFHLLVFLSLLGTPFGIKAQQNHFIYFQTEGRQPFYAKLNKKILSSSASGYLIIPKLKDGTYNITIGFPKNENGEQDYVCTIDNKDAGYLVKNFGDKGWGLFNLQSLDVVMSNSHAKTNDVAKVEKTDAFSTMLSDVVNDPTIKQAEKPADKPAETVKPTTDKKEIAEEPVKSKLTEVQNQSINNVVKLKEAAEGTVKPLPQINKSIITKKQINTDADGTVIVYIDALGEKQDTVRIFIPAEKSVTNNTEAVKPNELVIIEEKPKAEVKNEIQNAVSKQDSLLVIIPAKETTNTKTDMVVSAVKQDDAKMVKDVPATPLKDKSQDDKKFLPIELPVSLQKKEENIDDKSRSAYNNTNIVKPVEATEVMEAKTPMINSDCKNYATDDDFLKLRKKMAAVENDGEMITIAQKIFKTKCFTTSQVKNLSVLFLKDADKYKFFDLAYQYVSDSHNFSILETQLTDPYYISRFRAMVQH